MAGVRCIRNGKRLQRNSMTTSLPGTITKLPDPENRKTYVVRLDKDSKQGCVLFKRKTCCINLGVRDRGLVESEEQDERICVGKGLVANEHSEFRLLYHSLEKVDVWR